MTLLASVMLLASACTCLLYTSYIKDFAISDQGTVSIGGSLIRPQVLGSTSLEK